MTAEWICMDCAARNASSGNCTICGEGPLLDGRDALVRKTLRDQDAEAGRKRSRMLIAIAAGISGVVGLPFVLVLGQFRGRSPPIRIAQRHPVDRSPQVKAAMRHVVA